MICYYSNINMVFSHIKPLLRGFPKATSLWSLVFILIIVAAGRFAYSKTESFVNREESGSFSFGGPAGNSEGNLGFFSGSLTSLNGEYSDDEEKFLIFDGVVVLGTSHPLSNLIPTRDGLQKYKVQSGDTLSGIAAQFGLTLQTLRWANPGLRSAIRIGEELTILPVSGILHAVKEDDSIESVASRYQIDPNLIREYNPDYQKTLDSPGELLVLPNAKPLGNIGYARYIQNLPNLKSYFVLPARGWNWARLHDYNAVDIADQCGKPIYAAAEGLVIEESSEGYWNQGHGNYVFLEHPNGTKTRYSHTSENLVNVGDYVSQGDHVALIGNTGNTHGPTGCHLHFETHGAKNPFAIK